MLTAFDSQLSCSLKNNQEEVQPEQNVNVVELSNNFLTQWFMELEHLLARYARLWWARGRHEDLLQDTRYTGKYNQEQKGRQDDRWVGFIFERWIISIRKIYNYQEFKKVERYMRLTESVQDEAI